MTEFAPVSAAIGGALIGLAAVLLLWLNGQVAGVSGILYGLFSRHSGERNWRLLFVAGLVLGGLVYQWVTNTPLATRTEFPVPLLLVAGLLVGAGTRLGSGCTSGHGICGVSQLSQRSIIATITFIVVAIATTAVVRIFLVSGS